MFHTIAIDSQLQAYITFVGCLAYRSGRFRPVPFDSPSLPFMTEHGVSRKLQHDKEARKIFTHADHKASNIGRLPCNTMGSSAEETIVDIAATLGHTRAFGDNTAQRLHNLLVYA